MIIDLGSLLFIVKLKSDSEENASKNGGNRVLHRSVICTLFVKEIKKYLMTASKCLLNF
jgi:hypothetical protein